MLTNPQRKALSQAIADGGEIIMTGIDQTNPCPDRRTINNLVKLGYLIGAASPDIGFSIGLNDYYRITQAGKDALNAHLPEQGRHS